jgi:DNA polymerase-4
LDIIWDLYLGIWNLKKCMELAINHSHPWIMHIDLNSCFATIEQQANPLLRGKPLVVAAYSTPNAFILTPSIEAKQVGIKMGMQVRDALEVYPDVVVRTPNPTMYRDVHTRFKKIFQDYTPDVTPKSIDEAVLDFRPLANLKPDLIQIAREIKLRMKQEIGIWIRCSAGISTNMFLAKLAASLHKPDGLTMIDHTNLLDIYRTTDLMDLNGINIRYRTRLNVHRIFTPLQFLHAKRDFLHTQVFRSIVGSRWYEKLRGYEADQKEFSTKSIGQQYALKIPTDDRQQLERLMMKLCEKMGRRLRKKEFTAKGIHLWFLYRDHTAWHRGRLMPQEMYTTMELYRHAMIVFNQQPAFKRITHMGVSCYHLSEHSVRQLSLFDQDESKARRVAEAADELNDKYGEYTVVPGIMMEMDNVILDRIAFGGVKELEDLYN